MKNKETSFRSLLRLYTRVKIPWAVVIGSMLLSIALKEGESRMVPFLSKIETGAIEEHGFLMGFALLTISIGVIEALQGSINELGGAIMARNVRRTLWGKLIHLPMSVFRAEDPQRFVSRVTQDTTGAYAAITVMVQTISVGYGIYTNFVKMYRLYKLLALIMLTGIPLTILSAWITGKLEYQINTIVNSSYAAITSFFGERLPNLLHIKTCSMEDEEYLRGVEASNARYHAEIRYLNRFIFQAPIGTFVQYINEVVLLITASMMVRSGTMKMAQLVNLYNYYLLFMGNAFMLTAIWQGIKKSHGACATISQLMELEDEVLDAPVMPTESDITFEHVSFGYEPNRPVLKDVSFTIPCGKITAIVGENGCGKSTIIRLLEGFDRPDSGTIRLGTADMATVSLRKWREAVGYLFQGGQTVKGSIRDNLCYGLERPVTEEELIAAAKLARANDFIAQRENGFDDQISFFDSKLSGGELQRLAIARMILKQPKFLIMDEATSGIDVVSESEVLAGLRTIMEGRTVIMVSHDMNLIKKADHIIVLRDGVVEESGSFDTVSANSTLFQAFAAART